MINIKAQFRELAAPIERGEKIENVIGRAAKRVGMDYWRAYDFWYGKTRTMTEAEIENVATALAKKRKQESRNEVHELRMRLERLESSLVQTDEAFHRETIAALRASVRGRC